MASPQVRTPAGRPADAEVAQTVSHQSTAAEKTFATLQAKAALVGIALHRLEDGRLLAARWGLVRELADVDEAARWLDKVGAAR